MIKDTKGGCTEHERSDRRENTTQKERLLMGAMFAAFFGEGVWAIIRALLLLILAFIVSAIVKSLAAVVALSFGISGREFAGRMLKKLEDHVSSEEKHEGSGDL